MKRHERPGGRTSLPGLLFSLAVVVIYLFVLWTLSASVLGWLAFRTGDERGLRSAVTRDRGNATYHYVLGRFYHYTVDRPDYGKAISAYAASLSLNPLQAGVWIDLSKAYRLAGRSEDADDATDRALRLSPRNPELLWEAGISRLAANRIDGAIETLRKYVLLRPDSQQEVYDLCWKLGVSGSRILSDLVPPSYAYHAAYLRYLIQTNRIDESLPVWTVVDKESIEKDLFVAYADFLIRNGRYETADAVWREIAGRLRDVKTDDAAGLWNPGFEREILNGGFDWTIHEAKGVSVFVDDAIRMTGERSLGVMFDGNHNPDVTVARQVLQVRPGIPYAVRGYVKTDALTTTNGLFFQVQGHTCGHLDARSDVVNGTNFWKEVTVEFTPPPACGAVVLAIRRERSEKLDNKIGGTAWIDGISLRQLSASRTASSGRR